MTTSDRVQGRGALALGLAIGVAALLWAGSERLPGWMRPWAGWKPVHPQYAPSLDSLVTVALEIPEPVTAAPLEDIRLDPMEAGFPRFSAAMRRLKTGAGKVRIAYFGDSMIEGDLITLTVRSRLQQLFGGKGVGWVGMAPKEPGFRRSVLQRTDLGWKGYSILSGRTALPTGLSGEGWKLAEQGRGFHFIGTKNYAGSDTFRRARLFFGPPQHTDTAEYLVVSRPGGSDTLALLGDQLLNEISLLEAPAQQFSLKLYSQANRPWFGVSLEDWTGVYLDNFALRGNTGLQLSLLPDSVLRAFQKRLNYDLVVLQFGVNLIQTDRKDYHGYAQAFARVIAYLKRQMPDADFLVIGVSDKATRIGGLMRTDPSIPYILEAQHAAARETGCAFFNLFEAMGGAQTMTRWAEEKPTLANKDYTHPNFGGAQVLGDLIFEYLMDAVAEYEIMLQPSAKAAKSP